MEPTHYFGYIVNGHRSCVSVCHPSILALIHLHSSIPTEIRRASTTTTTTPSSSSSNDHRGRNRRTRILLHGLVQSQQIWRASDEGQELGQVLVLICKTIVVTAENSLIISPPLISKYPSRRPLFSLTSFGNRRQRGHCPQRRPLQFVLLLVLLLHRVRLHFQRTGRL